MSAQPPTKSGYLDWIFALASLALVGIPLVQYWESYPTFTRSYVIFNAFLVIRVHLQILWLGGMGSFIYLSSRFPTIWINTMVWFPFLFLNKLIQFVISECIYLDPHGVLYECNIDSDFTMERYYRMAEDLNKPLFHRHGSTWWNFSIYPNKLSDNVVANIYTLGPLCSYGVLTIYCSDYHVVFRNGLFGTHPAYNYHNTLFWNKDKGKAYWHTVSSLLPGWIQIYDYLWQFYSERAMMEIIKESESRKKFM